MAPLPPKQSGTFKKILKCYDYKQYKFGLKLTKTILSNPETANHGETLAMKGLILNSYGRKEEAQEFIRRGLRNDLTSHVCWHVYGLLQRSEHKYDEAIKCYRNALKYDKDNITILRDLSLLQIQMRDLQGFRDTRRELFLLRPTQRVSWLSFAVAYHLLNDYNMAVRILNEFRATQNNQKEINDSNTNGQPEPIDYEQSELFLYQVMILLEAQNYKDALELLDKNSSQICDRLAVLEYRAELLIGLGKNAEAVKFIQDSLIHRNHENYHYYSLLEKALNIDPSDEVNRLNLYKSIQEKYPRSQVPFKIPLSFVQDPENFKQLVDSYLRKLIRKCLPALFRNLKSIYESDYKAMVDQLNQSYVAKLKTSANRVNDKQQADADKSSEKPKTGDNLFFIESHGVKPDEIRKIRKIVLHSHSLPPKIKIIQELMLSYERNLKENISFDSDPSTKNSENKTILLWVYYYLAQHYDYLGNYEEALRYVKMAIDHTPTLIESLTLKGKIYKHLGELDKAVEQVNEAQRLDTADRYLNSKCAKYLLRANKIAQAEEMCSKFTRAGVPAAVNLNEMQCMWFQTETARAHHRMKQYGQALKKCHEMDAYFTEVTEDQFDFHNYCMRKVTLRSYVKLLRLENVLRSHRFYFDAAELAIRIYLKLYDEPLVEGKENQNENDGSSKLSASELRKIKSKERKAAAKQQNQKNATNKTGGGHHNSDGASAGDGEKNKQKGGSSQQQAQNSGDSTASGSEASALDPQALEHPKDPLEQAIRFLMPLKSLATNQIETHLLAFEVYRRKNKLMLMLQSVKRASKLEPMNSRLMKQIDEFKTLAEAATKNAKLSGPVKRVLESELPKLLHPHLNEAC